MLEKLKRAMDQNGVTMEDLSEHLGITCDHLESVLFHGDICIDQVNAIVSYLNLPISEAIRIFLE